MQVQVGTPASDVPTMTSHSHLTKYLVDIRDNYPGVRSTDLDRSLRRRSTTVVVVNCHLHVDDAADGPEWLSLTWLIDDLGALVLYVDTHSVHVVTCAWSTHPLDDFTRAARAS